MSRYLYALAFTLLAACGKEELPKTDGSACITIVDTYQHFTACTKIAAAQRQRGDEALRQAESFKRVALDRPDDQAAANVAANTCKSAQAELLELMKQAGC